MEEVAAALPTEYQLADEQWNPCEPQESCALGFGGSSMVLRCLFRQRLRRAIKVFLPREDLRGTLDMAHFVASYENELLRQSSLNHHNLSKITDFAIVKIGDEDYPFIATEYIEGLELSEFAEKKDTTGEEIVATLKDVLRGMNYLHQNGVMHCDIKEPNILVSRNPDPLAIIVDLGSSRHFPSQIQSAVEEELVYLFTTTSYVPSRLRLLVSNWTNNRIARGELRRYFPFQDLHAFGIILENFLDNPKVYPKLRKAIGAGSIPGLKAVRERLRDPRPGDEHFQNAQQVAESLDRVSKYSLSVLKIPELSLAPERGVVIPGKASRVASTGRVDRIMSHPLFQRFHHLPQLDLLYWTLPGATQTRYVHAAHAFDIAREAVGYLLNNWQVRLEISVKDIEATLFSALLNQMGHYHFLHMFEDFIESRPSDPQVLRAGLLSDDELLDDILLEQRSEAAKVLGAVKDERGRTIGDIVESLGLDWGAIREAQRAPKNPLQGTLAALLSGPLDVEKLAYLSDDSRSAGLQFGIGLNGSPIFESLVVPRADDWRREGGVAGITLGITERAMSYLEYGVLTRYWNIQAAYWNRTNRAVQSMLKYQIASLLRADALDFTSYLIDTLHMGPDGALRWLNSRFQYAKDDGLIDDAVINPMEDLLQSRRVIYRRLLTISGRSAIPGRDPDHLIFSRARSQSALKDDHVTSLIQESLTSVHRGLGIRPGEILVDLPRVSRDISKSRVLVYTDDDYQFMGELFKISPNLQQHELSFDQYVKRMRVYLHPRIYHELVTRDLVARAHAASLDALRGALAR